MISLRRSLALERAHKLAKASELVKAKGYRLKIWDAYRPVPAQKLVSLKSTLTQIFRGKT